MESGVKGLMFTKGVWFRLPSRQALLVESTFLNKATLRFVDPIVLALDNKLCRCKINTLF